MEYTNPLAWGTINGPVSKDKHSWAAKEARAHTEIELAAKKRALEKDTLRIEIIKEILADLETSMPITLNLNYLSTCELRDKILQAL